MYGHRGRVDPGIGEARRGEPVGQRFDEVHRLARRDRDQPLGEFAVMHGVGDLVGHRRRRQIQLEHDIDDKVLPLLPLADRKNGKE